MNPYQPGSPAQDPEALRQRAIDRLTEAFASGVITMEEYERRVSQASALSRVDALEDLVSDLPAVVPREAPRGRNPTRLPAPVGRNHDIIGAPAVSTACIMGDRNLTGNWLTSDRVTTFTVMGSTKIDLREADLPPGRIKIEVFTVMGDTKIIVPPGLPVHLNSFVLMGDSRADRDVNQQTRGADTWVEVSGFVVMGDIRVHAMA